MSPAPPPAPEAPQGVLFPPDLHDVRHLQLKGALLLLWMLVSFVAMGYWIAAQGGVLVFIAIVVAYGWAMNRLERMDAQAQAPQSPQAGAPRHG